MQRSFLDKGESIGADISPYTNKPLTHEELETARRVIENKLSAIPKGLYEITTQRGMYKNYDTNEVDVEPSFHVTLNTTDPKYTNAFVMALNEFAQEHGQQSFILTKYIDDSDMNVFSSTGENGGQVTPGIYIKFSSPLNEEQKMIVAKLAIEKGLAGLSISDDGSHATAYDAGDLYGTDPQDFVKATAAFSEAITGDGGSEGIKGTVESYAQETWAYTADPRRSGAGSYQQLDRYSKAITEGQTVLGFVNPNTRIIDTKGLKGKELSVARINNAMASAGMDQETIDTNEVDVEPSFHVTLNTTDPKYTNAFVMALNEFAKEHGQQSFILTKYIEDVDVELFGTIGESGGQIAPAIHVKFDNPLTEKQKDAVVKLAIDNNLPGLSIADDGTYATVYHPGDLYGTDAKEFKDSAKEFAKAIELGAGDEGIAGMAQLYAQEEWAYTSEPKRVGAGSYAQLNRYHETLKEGETVLGFKNPNTRIIDTEGLKGKELSVARVNNAMASAGMDQNTIDATTGVMVDIVERLAKSFAPGILSDEMFEQFFSCIQYVDESITDSTVAEILENLSSGSVPDTVFQEKLDDRFDTLLDKSKSSEDVSGSADLRKLIITKRLIFPTRKCLKN